MKPIATNILETTAVTLLGQWTSGLPKDACTLAISSYQHDGGEDLKRLTRSVRAILEAFKPADYSKFGIHRVHSSGNNNLDEALKRVGTGDMLEDEEMKKLSADDKACVLSKAIRKLPDTLLPRSQHTVLLDLGGSLTPDATTVTINRTLKALCILIHFIPGELKDCLRGLLRHCQMILEKSSANLMDASRLNVVFVPIVFPLMGHAGEDYELFGRIFDLMLSNRKKIFELPAEMMDTLGETMHRGSASDSTRDDATISMSFRYADASASSMQPTTDAEVEKLIAQIEQMPDTPYKQEMLKRARKTMKKPTPKKPTQKKGLMR